MRNLKKVVAFLVISIALVSSQKYCAGFGLGKLLSFEQEPAGIKITCQSESGEKVFLKITICSPALLRVRGSLAEKLPESILVKNDIIKNDWPPTKFDLSETEQSIFLETELFVLKINKKPVRLSFYNKQNNLLLKESKGIELEETEVIDTFHLAEDEHFFGFGEKTEPLDKRNRQLVMWNVDHPGYGPTTDPLYKSIPFFLSTKGYGIFLANTYKTMFDLGKTQSESFFFQAKGGIIDYYFIYGPSFKEIVRQYTELTGRPPLPPKWALGLSISKWGYTQKDIEQIYQGFRAENIPCDIVILDLEWVDKFWNFQWDAKNYPDPEVLIKDLTDSHFRLCVIIDPVVETGAENYAEGHQKGYFVKNSEGATYQTQWPWGGTVGLVDFTNPQANTWWWEQHKHLLDMGIDGFWIDMNEPARYADDMVHLSGAHDKIHNIYPLLNAKMMHENLRQYKPDKRVWLLSRSAFAGIQQYAFSWSGDCPSSFSALRCQIQMGQNVGLSGIPYWGSDIGGFMSNTTPELYTRWMQFGAFTPLARIHSSLSTRSRVPWLFGDEIEEVMRQYIKLRYRLLPYIYTYAYQANQTGLPIMRPMVLEYPDDTNTYQTETQYMFGKEILVAPVCESSGDLFEEPVGKTIYFPRGEWIDYWTGELYQGTAFIGYEAPLKRLPLFIRAGAIIPLGPDLNYVDEKPLTPLTLDIYPSGLSSWTLYEDDGETYAYERGEFALTKFTCNQTQDKIEITIGAAQGNYRGKLTSRSWWLRVHSDLPQSVEIDGHPAKQSSLKEELLASPQGWWFDSSRRIIEVKVGENLSTSRNWSVILKFTP